MNKISVSAISYTNTIPFVYGLENFEGISDQISLQFDLPAICASNLISGKVDLGIVPVAALPEIPAAKIISDYCIGADGAVNSVFLFSKVPLEKISTVQLDSQSRSSNNLAKILEKNCWKCGIKFNELPDPDPNAIILIGDRTFTGRKQWAYQVDLAAEWKKFTGLPFVFAVWAANRVLSPEFEALFNKALAFGLDHRMEVQKKLPPVPGFDLEDYLMNKISYNFDAQKKNALELYLEFMNKLENEPAQVESQS